MINWNLNKMNEQIIVFINQNIQWKNGKKKTNRIYIAEQLAIHKWAWIVRSRTGEKKKLI